MRSYTALAKPLSVLLLAVNAWLVYLGMSDLSSNFFRLLVILGVGFGLFHLWWLARGAALDPQPRLVTAIRWCSVFALLACSSIILMPFLALGGPLMLVLPIMGGAVGLVIGLLMPKLSPRPKEWGQV